MSFAEDNYKIIRNLIPESVCEVATNYLTNKKKVAHWMLDEKIISPAATFNYWIFTDDTQVPGSYCTYGDVLFDSILEQYKPVIEEALDLTLVENYSYTRIYFKGNELKRHKDRPSCEISGTINLGGDQWPIFLEPSGETGKPGVEVKLNPGDALFYKGCELEHWRDPFEGNVCYQTFFHYNDVNSKLEGSARYDGRPLLGIPKGGCQQ